MLDNGTRAKDVVEGNKFGLMDPFMKDTGRPILLMVKGDSFMLTEMHMYIF
jgi:hypothetical protein